MAYFLVAETISLSEFIDWKCLTEYVHTLLPFLIFSLKRTLYRPKYNNLGSKGPQSKHFACSQEHTPKGIGELSCAYTY